MSDTRYRILLVEDDQSLGYVLSEYLRMKGFEIAWAREGESAVGMLSDNKYDLAILDVMMPKMDGFTLAGRLQKECPEMPFLFLSARSMKIDVLKGLSVGAVDYLKKPIDEEELVARIEALLQRIGTRKDEAQQSSYDIGAYHFNFLNQELKFQGDTIRLTSRENELLQFLVSNRNQLCTHKDILLQLWGKNDYFNKKSLNVFVTHLRKHLERDKRIKIENVHGRGFILRVGLETE